MVQQRWGVVMHQLVGMGEMRRMGEMREKIYLNLPHLPHIHSRQKDHGDCAFPNQISLELG
jgi:hypothetical protein